VSPRIVVAVLALLLAGVARAESLGLAGLPGANQDGDSWLLVEAGRSAGRYPDSTAYHRYAAQVRFSASWLNDRDVSGAGHAVAPEFEALMGIAPRESPSLGDAVHIPVSCDVAVFATFRVLALERSALVLFLGPSAGVGGQDWAADLARLSLHLGARFTTRVGGHRIVTEARWIPFQAVGAEGGLERTELQGAALVDFGKLLVGARAYARPLTRPDAYRETEGGLSAVVGWYL
jgi:hypothetical protein